MKIKILYIAFVLYALLFVGKRVYWFCLNDYNNLNITISNQCNGCLKYGKMIPFSVEIYIDDSLFYKKDSIDRYYVGLSERIKLGKHHITVIVDSNITFSDNFYILPMKWIYIEYPIDEPCPLSVSFELSPPGLM